MADSYLYEFIFVANFSASIAAKKFRYEDVINDAADVDDVDIAAESDADDDRKSLQGYINLEAITNKELVPIRVKCWDCTKVITTSKLFKPLKFSLSFKAINHWLACT